MRFFNNEMFFITDYILFIVKAFVELVILGVIVIAIFLEMDILVMFVLDVTLTIILNYGKNNIWNILF